MEDPKRDARTTRHKNQRYKSQGRGKTAANLHKGVAGSRPGSKAGSSRGGGAGQRQHSDEHHQWAVSPQGGPESGGDWGHEEEAEALRTVEEEAQRGGASVGSMGVTRETWARASEEEVVDGVAEGLMNGADYGALVEEQIEFWGRGSAVLRLPLGSASAFLSAVGEDDLLLEAHTEQEPLPFSLDLSSLAAALGELPLLECLDFFDFGPPEDLLESTGTPSAPQLPLTASLPPWHPPDATPTATPASAGSSSVTAGVARSKSAGHARLSQLAGASQSTRPTHAVSGVGLVPAAPSAPVTQRPHLPSSPADRASPEEAAEALGLAAPVVTELSLNDAEGISDSLLEGGESFGASTGAAELGGLVTGHSYGVREQSHGLRGHSYSPKQPSHEPKQLSHGVRHHEDVASNVRRDSRHADAGSGKHRDADSDALLDELLDRGKAGAAEHHADEGPASQTSHRGPREKVAPSVAGVVSMGSGSLGSSSLGSGSLDSGSLGSTLGSGRVGDPPASTNSWLPAQGGVSSSQLGSLGTVGRTGVQSVGRGELGQALEQLSTGSSLVRDPAVGSALPPVLPASLPSERVLSGSKAAALNPDEEFDAFFDSLT